VLKLRTKPVNPSAGGAWFLDQVGGVSASVRVVDAADGSRTKLRDCAKRCVARAIRCITVRYESVTVR
jgi:hypothetical protein